MQVKGSRLKLKRDFKTLMFLFAQAFVLNLCLKWFILVPDPTSRELLYG